MSSISLTPAITGQKRHASAMENATSCSTAQEPVREIASNVFIHLNQAQQSIKPFSLEKLNAFKNERAIQAIKKPSYSPIKIREHLLKVLRERCSDEEEGYDFYNYINDEDFFDPYEFQSQGEMTMVKSGQEGIFLFWPSKNKVDDYLVYGPYEGKLKFGNFSKDYFFFTQWLSDRSTCVHVIDLRTRQLTPYHIKAPLVDVNGIFIANGILFFYISFEKKTVIVANKLGDSAHTIVDKNIIPGVKGFCFISSDDYLIRAFKNEIAVTVLRNYQENWKVNLNDLESKWIESQVEWLKLTENNESLDTDPISDVKKLKKEQEIKRIKQISSLFLDGSNLYCGVEESEENYCLQINLRDQKIIDKFSSDYRITEIAASSLWVCLGSSIGVTVHDRKNGKKDYVDRHSSHFRMQGIELYQSILLYSCNGDSRHLYDLIRKEAIDDAGLNLDSFHGGFSGKHFQNDLLFFQTENSEVGYLDLLAENSQDDELEEKKSINDEKVDAVNSLPTSIPPNNPSEMALD